MKLLFAIVDREDAAPVIQNLNQRGYQSTRLDATGGFLMKENVTLMIGIDDMQVQPVIEIIREYSHKRTTLVSDETRLGHGQAPSSAVEVSSGGGTIFCVDVDRFEKV